MFDSVRKVKDNIISGAATIFNGIFFNKQTEKQNEQNAEVINYSENVPNSSQSGLFPIIESQYNKNNAAQFFQDDSKQISHNYDDIRRFPLEYEDHIEEGKDVFNQEIFKASSSIYQPSNTEDTYRDEIPFNLIGTASSFGITGQELNLNYDDSLSQISNQSYKTAVSEIIFSDVIDEDDSCLQSCVPDLDNISKGNECEQNETYLARLRNYWKNILIPQEKASNLVRNNEYPIESPSTSAQDHMDANPFSKSHDRIFNNEYLATNHDRTTVPNDENQEYCFQTLSEPIFLSNDHSFSSLSGESLIINDAEYETNETVLFDSNLYYKPVSKENCGSNSNIEDIKRTNIFQTEPLSSPVFQTSDKRKDNETVTTYIHRGTMPMAIQKELEANISVKQTSDYFNFSETNNSRLPFERTPSSDKETYLENYYKEENMRNAHVTGSNNRIPLKLSDSAAGNMFYPKQNSGHVCTNMDATESRTTDSCNEIVSNLYCASTDGNIISPGFNCEDNIDEETNAEYIFHSTAKNNSECCTEATPSNSKRNTIIEKQKIAQLESEKLQGTYVKNNSVNSAVEDSSILHEGSYQTVSEDIQWNLDKNCNSREGDNDVLFMCEIPGPSNCYKTNQSRQNQQISMTNASPKMKEEIGDTSEFEKAPKKRKINVVKSSTSLESAAPLLLSRPSRISISRSGMNVKTLKSNATTSNEQKHSETLSTSKTGSEFEKAPKKRKTNVVKSATSLESTAPLLLSRPSRISFSRSEMNVKTLKSNATTSNEQKHSETRSTSKTGLTFPQSLGNSSEVKTNPQIENSLNSNAFKLSMSSAPIKDNVRRVFKVLGPNYQPKESLVSLDQLGDINMPKSTTFNSSNNPSMCIGESSLFEDRSASSSESISTVLDSYDMEHESNCLNQNFMGSDDDCTIQISDTILEDNNMEIDELE